MADRVLARDRGRARGAPRLRLAWVSWRALLAPERAERLLRRTVGLDRRTLAAARYREPHRRAGGGARRTGGAAGEFARAARLGGYSQSRRTRRKPAAGDHADPDG